MKDSNQSNLNHSYAKQFTKSPLKEEDSFYGFGDPYHISGKDPARAYKDISFDAFKKNGYRDIRGWIPLTKANKTTEVLPSSDDYGVSSDAFYHRGDCIVAFMPKERYKMMREKIMQKVKLQNDAAMRGGNAAEIAKKLHVDGKPNLTIEGE